MATGTGTGTPATGASALTLNAIRDRVRTQLEHAHGAPDPVPVEASTETLSILHDRVELHLQDSGNSLRAKRRSPWASAAFDEAIEKALEAYIRHSPRLAVTTLTLSADGREVDLSTITGLLRLTRVWWPYTQSPGATPSRQFPPHWVSYEAWGPSLFIDSST
jgi:hypothetical protein